MTEFRPYFFYGEAKGITADEFLEKIQVHDGKILVEHIEPPQKIGSLHMSDDVISANTEAACFVIVLKIGKFARVSEIYAEKMSFPLEEGDVVMAAKFLGSKIKIDGRTFRFINVDQIDGRLGQ